MVVLKDVSGTRRKLLSGEAQVSFVDEETEVRKRPIPPPVQVSPRVSVSTHGDVTLGLELTF